MRENRSILLVDDVELFLELERTFFHRAGFDLLMAINAQEIMQLVLQRKPELIFLDMQISETRGDDICRWIKQDRDLQSIPVIMLVAAGDLKSESLCRQAGCDAIIHSPVKRQELLTVARRFLQLSDRQLGRIGARLLVQFGQSPAELTDNYSVNLSPGGVFIATHHLLPVDSSLALQLELPRQNNRLACRGRVAWLNHPEKHKKPHLPTGMGVQFSDLVDEQLVMVKRYLARKAA